MMGKRYRYVFKKESILIILGIFIGLLTLIGVSYALVKYYTNDDGINSVIAGNLKIEFKEGDNLKLDNMYPMTIEEGMNVPVYNFNITNTGTVNAKYVVKLLEDDKSLLVDNKYMMISYQKGNDLYTIPRKISELGKDLIIDESGFLEVSKNINYNIKIWLDSSAPNSEMGKVYKTKVVVEAVNTITNSLVDRVSPAIKLKGTSVINLEKGADFIDPGIDSVTDNIDKVSTSDVNISYEYYDGTNLYIENKIDTKKSGVYYIYYEVFDNNLNREIEVRVVNINNQNNYSIKLLGDSTININNLDNYKDSGAQIIDINKKAVNTNIIKINGINTNTENKIYFIKYVYKDNLGGIYSNIRKVKVKEAYTIYDAITKNDINKYFGNLEEVNNKIYIEGSNPNNYFMYINILFRVISVDKTNKSIMAITDKEVDNLVPSSNVYKDSNIYNSLNNDFLSKLSNKDYLIKNSDNSYVSLLTKEDYNKTYKSVLPSMGYLVKTKDFIIIDKDMVIVDTKGVVKDISLDEEKMIRPVISLNGSLVVTGSGTINDPYLLK